MSRRAAKHVRVHNQHSQEEKEPPARSTLTQWAVVAWGLVAYAATHLAGMLLESASLASAMAQAVIAEWAGARMGILWTSPSHAKRFPHAAKPWRRIAIGAAFGAGAAMLAVGFLVVGRATILVREKPTVAAVALTLATSGLEAVRAEFLLRGVVLRALQSARISALGKVLACGAIGAIAAVGASDATLPSVLFNCVLGLGFGALWVHDRGVWMAWSAHTVWVFATSLFLGAPPLYAGAPMSRPLDVSVHASGAAIVRADAPGFAVRLNAIRAVTSGLAVKKLDQAQGKEKEASELFEGGPIVHVMGDGELALVARQGYKLMPFVLRDELCFVRDDVLVGWDCRLTSENGRIATGGGESWAIVQLRGSGAVLVETRGEVLSVDVVPSRGVSVRREAVLWWFGRLVARALGPSEAPCGQRGLIAFAGEGRVVVMGS
ncbi:MAG: hypothetical protein FWD73_03960 [Polyangiaceae bacterium]|nr:hypothetical protein [Polyangiaceae bacterium]